MEYRRLGATDLQVSEIGFGGWGIGGDVHGAVAYGPTNDRETELCLRRAFDQGVNLFDTADIYGSGHSEELLGRAFGSLRSRALFATKVGLLNAEGSSDYSAGHIRRSVEKSLRRLRTDYIDLYQLHSPTIDTFGDGDVLTELQRLQKEGKIRAYGVSLRSPDDGLILVEKCRIDCIQANFNMMDLRIVDNGLLALCKARDVGVIGRTPLCFGFLTGQYSEDTDFHRSDHRRRWPREQLRTWTRGSEVFADIFASQKGQTRTQIALRFCLSYPEISSVIPGMLTREHVDENLAASELGKLGPAELQQIADIYSSNEFFVRENNIEIAGGRMGATSCNKSDESHAQ